MRAPGFGFAAASSLIALPASAVVINVSPADGDTAYTLIEGANAGDEVIIAPGTYSFRVYLQNQGTAAQPIYIHAEDPTNPPVWTPGTFGTVDKMPGDYTGGDTTRGCWQVSGGTNYTIESIVFKGCTASSNDSAGLRYYSGTTGLQITNCLFEDNDNGLTGGTEDSDATVEFCEFSGNGNLNASGGSPTHNIYIYGGTFTLRYSYLHDPLQAQNLHCRAVDSVIEYNWFDRAKSYVGDLMTSDDYANNPTGSLVQSMTLRGNVIVQGSEQANDSQMWAIFNDEASGSPVSFSVTALYNTVVGAGGHAAFLHVSNADGTQMTAAASDNVISGTSIPILVEDTSAAQLSGSNNWIESGAATTGLSGSVTGASPGFNGAATYDFTLASGSACIGAADMSVAGGLPTQEYFQNETVTRMYRVRAAAADLGAFEHDTTGPGIGPYSNGAGGGGSGPASSSSGAGGGSTSSSSSTSGGGGASTGSTGSSSGAGAGGSSSSGGTMQSSAGCKCGTASGEGPGAAPWLLGLALVAVRRRRS